MSKAGIQSNRGDGYQTLVAFDWALTVLSDPNYEWLEVDSVSWLVDDVVIGKSDGTIICCQCKKNQTRHKPWTVSDLKDELEKKAGPLLARSEKVFVKFYSRTAFGELAVLSENSENYADSTTYQANLGKATRATDERLKNVLPKSVPYISTYDFLRRTSFENTPDLERMQEHLHERLGRLVSNTPAAYQALWTRLGCASRVQAGHPGFACASRTPRFCD